MPFKRGNVWWITVRGHRQSAGKECSSRKEAKELEENLNRDSWRAEKLGIKFNLWDDACLDWFKRNAHLRAVSLSEIYSAWWEPYFSGKPLNQITGDLVREIVERDRPVNTKAPIPANTTANHYMAFVRKIMRHGGRPIKVSMLPVSGGRTDWFSVEQWHALELEDDLRHAATFSLSTGLRRGNVIGFRWDWLRGDDDSYQIPPGFTKTTKPYSAPLCKTAQAIIKERRRSAIRHPEFVFLLEGRVIYPMLLQRAWDAALAANEVPHMPFHSLRHTYASWMVQAGVAFEIVARLGQWKVTHGPMVNRYAHFDTESLRNSAERFDTVFAQSQGRNESEQQVSA